MAGSPCDELLAFLDEGTGEGPHRGPVAPARPRADRPPRLGRGPPGPGPGPPAPPGRSAPAPGPGAGDPSPGPGCRVRPTPARPSGTPVRATPTLTNPRALASYKVICRVCRAGGYGPPVRRGRSQSAPPGSCRARGRLLLQARNRQRRRTPRYLRPLSHRHAGAPGCTGKRNSSSALSLFIGHRQTKGPANRRAAPTVE